MFRQTKRGEITQQTMSAWRAILNAGKTTAATNFNHAMFYTELNISLE
jgi:hypothetical protein